MDLTPLVDLFIGTQGTVPGTSYNGGNVFPGAALPFGAVKVGIDTTEFNSSTDATAGYTPDGNVTAITMLHESGTGGAPTYGLIPQMPLTTLEGVNVMDNLTYMQPRTNNDTASVGYYASQLTNGVGVELAASMHAGFMQYTFPSDSSKYILVDLSHYLPTQDDSIASQAYSNGVLDIANNGSAYSGSGTFRGGWSEGPDFDVYFSAEFDTTPQSVQLWHGPFTDPYWPNSTNANATFLDPEVTHVQGGRPGYNYADRIGVLFQFPANATVVRSKVGVSWISSDKAQSMLDDEIPAFDFNGTVDAAKDAWNSNILNQITLSSDAATNSTRNTMLYSALYRSHLLPSNRTTENPNWDTLGEPTFDDYYTAWDTFRCLNSMYNLLSPDTESQIVRSLIDIWRHEQFMPDGRSHFYNGRVQGGSNADNILADAYVKGLRGAINWTDGYHALLTDAETNPYNNFDPEDLSQSTKQGRGGLDNWHQYGYITLDYSRAVSKTVEYSLNDFAVSQVAQGEGAPGDAQKYLNRSAGWQRIWRPIDSLNFTGFLAPLYENGTVMEGYDPLSCGSCEWMAIAYEATPWEYSWTVPFDMQSLIQFMGGPMRTEQRLDAMFVPGLRPGSVGSGGNNGIGDTLFNPGNEPSFQTPFLYNYLGSRQYKSVMRSRETVNQYYNIGPSGLPGNSDAGAVDSWLIWNLIGMYPVVTQPVYLLLSPWFSDITLTVGNGKTLRVTADNLAEDSYYVQNVTLNGALWTQNWVSHDNITGGGPDGSDQATLHFVLGSQQTEWDTGPSPPSPGHVDMGGPPSSR
ncbi:MAG: hypothetical protein Q9162_002957 [Coniocarpon cinnabarinum]